MTGYATFSVFSAGSLVPGFDRSQVCDALARLFSIGPEKVELMLNGRRLLKKGISQEEAEELKRKLEHAGLAVVVEPLAPAPATAGQRLTLEPVVGEESAAEPAEPAAMSCPKCAHEQPAGAEQCAGCGIYFHKLQPAVQAPDAAAGFVDNDDVAEEADNVLQPKAIAAAAVAALLGALLWKFIAVAFEYELAIVAWGIGAAVGFAAAAMGSRGRAAGVLCAVLVVFSILAGKYLAVETIRADVAESIAMEMEGDGLRPLYEELIYDAEVYPTVGDEASLRQFMIDHDYTEATTPEAISDEEIEFFEDFSGPQLEAFAAGPPSYEDWVSGAYSEVAELSSAGLVIDSLGLFDLLFLGLGVVTAFRLGSQRETA